MDIPFCFIKHELSFYFYYGTSLPRLRKLGGIIELNARKHSTNKHACPGPRSAHKVCGYLLGDLTLPGVSRSSICRQFRTDDRYQLTCLLTRIRLGRG